MYFFLSHNSTKERVSEAKLSVETRDARSGRGAKTPSQTREIHSRYADLFLFFQSRIQ